MPFPPDEFRAAKVPRPVRRACGPPGTGRGTRAGGGAANSAGGVAWPRKCAGRALTLLEVLLVVSLVGALALLAWPQFVGSKRRAALDESTRRLKSLVAMCRAEAMNTGRRYRVAIRPDGGVKVRRQVDPVGAPQEFGLVGADWEYLAFMLPDAWVESVVLLPEGPPPVVVERDLVAFEQANVDVDWSFEPIPVQEFESSVVVEFQPDGTSDSLRWVVRDRWGRGVQMTLDGRLGRVRIEPVEAREAQEVERPPPLEAGAAQDAWDRGAEERKS